MSRGIPSRTASACCWPAVTARLLCGLIVEAPCPHNGAWLSILLGAALSIPFMWLISRPSRFLRLPAAILAVPLAMDAGRMLELTAFSAAYIALDHVSELLLAVPLVLSMGLCLYRGAESIGNAARLWVPICALLIATVFVFQLPKLRPMWLAPLLGPGVAGILRQAVRAAIWIVSLFAASVWIEKPGERPVPFKRRLVHLLLAASSAALIVVLSGMMSPARVVGPDTRSIRLDALLANGRSPMYLQLPMIVAWFIAMFNLSACQAALSVELIRLSLPTLPRFVCALLVGGIAIGGLWMCHLSELAYAAAIIFISAWASLKGVGRPWA